MFNNNEKKSTKLGSTKQGGRRNVDRPKMDKKVDKMWKNEMWFYQIGVNRLWGIYMFIVYFFSVIDWDEKKTIHIVILQLTYYHIYRKIY